MRSVLRKIIEFVDFSNVLAEGAGFEPAVGY